MFDQLGGLGRLVKGKTVAIKINLTGGSGNRLGYAKLEDSHYSHPAVIGAAVHLMGRAGAHRIRIVESAWNGVDPVEECLIEANWEPLDILNAAPRVEFENTNFLGKGKKYSRLPVPHGGHMFKAIDVNHSYEDCDVFVSLAKMKEHATAGITLAIKNCFGILPCTIYGDGAGVDEPSLRPRGGRGPLHNGNRQPSKSAPPENDPASPREGGYRIPRVVADIAAARPIHLSIVDGIRTMAGGEGPWIPNCPIVDPGVMVIGTNSVSTDAVAMAVMGYDPMAGRGVSPFRKGDAAENDCDNTLELAEKLGAGTRDLKRIEIAGDPVRDVLFSFAEVRRRTRASRASRTLSQWQRFC